MIKRVFAKVSRAICKRRFLGSGALLLFLSACGLVRCTPDPLPRAQMDELYSEPLTAPDAGLRVFHLGHSLVNRDMPFLIQQLADAAEMDHGYDSQIGWGTPLKSHWEPEEEIFGFDQENAHNRFRDVFEALDSGDYDVFIATEMVEITDAIEYFGSADYLHRFAARARAGNPAIRVYLYETWHEVTDPQGWRTRLEKDRARYWEDGVLRPALAYTDPPLPIYVIPVGQVLAEVSRRIEAGQMPGLTTSEDLFARTEDGVLDPIHVEGLGNYIAALTHFSVLYHRAPTGLPHNLQLHDSKKTLDMDPALAAQLQALVWDVVRDDPLSGVAKSDAGNTDQ